MNKKNNIILYLLIVLILWIFSFIALQLILKSYSINYYENGNLTFGYILYVLIGLLFTTPAPFISAFIVSVIKEHKSVKIFLKNIFKTKNFVNTMLLTLLFCLIPFIYALINGEPNGTKWYIMPVSFLIMIPFVGIAEEAGWRGLLFPRLEKKYNFLIAFLITSFIWYIWHFDLWLDPTSNHFGDSLIGFGITIFIWSFALAVLYKITNSILACAIYHSFMDSIGSIFDWNLLFDSFPGNINLNIFRIIWLSSSIAILLLYYKKKKKN